MILRIGLGSLGRNLHADLRNEAFRAYRRSFPVLSGRLRTRPRGGRGRRSMMDDKKRITTEIRDYLARQRISREQFAHQTKLGKSTVDKLLTGLFSERTLVIVESHTGLKLREKPDAASSAPAPGAAEALPAPTGPSIAVLPFTNLAGNPEQDYLADGITEDIITALARLRWLFVIARNSSFVYKGRAVDVRQVSRELGVRYVLEGSVRTAGDRIRISSQLIEAETGKHIWAERYDRELRDVFAVLDEITEQVVAAVEPHLYAEEGFRAGEQAARQHRRLGAGRPRAEPDQQDRSSAERGGAQPAAPGDRHGSQLCACPCAAELGAVVGGLLLLAARPARWLSRVGGRSGVRGLARCQRPVGAHDLRALAQPGGAARARARRAARRACAQPELRARAHGVRLGALPCRRLRRGRERDRARACA